MKYAFLIFSLISLLDAFAGGVGDLRPYCRFQIFAGDPSTLLYRKELAKPLDTGEPIKAIWVLTHPKNIEKAAVDLMSQKEFENTPRLILASQHWQVRSEELLGQASRVEHSESGEFHSKVNADVIHLGGGYCGLCLSRTFTQLVQDSLSYPERKKVTVILHKTAAFAIRDFGRGVTTWSDEAILTGLVGGIQVEKNLFDFGFHFVDPHREASPYLMKRLTDGKELEIFIQDP